MKILLALSIGLNVYLLLTHRKRRSVNHSAVRIVFKIIGMRKRIKKMNLKANDMLPVSIQAEDKFGNSVDTLDAAPAWTVSDETMGSVESSEDGMSAEFTPSGKEGTVLLQVLAQEDGKQIAGTLEVNVIAGDATKIVIAAGTPVEHEDAPSDPAPTDPTPGV